MVVKVCAIVVPHDDAHAAAPDTLPESKAAVHVKVVPETFEFKATLLALPVHTDCAEAEPVGFGLTTMVAVVGLPTQKVDEGPVGVIVKVTVTGALVVLVKVTPVMLVPLPLAATPVTALVLSRVHANVVPVTVGLVPKVIVVNAVPVHILWLLLVTVAVGVVLTVIVTVLLICWLHKVVALVPITLNVVVELRLPVGNKIVPPVPVTGEPTFVLPLLLRSW